MKKVLFILMTLMLMAGSTASAQEPTDDYAADKAEKIAAWQKKLDEDGNPLRVRIEGYEELYIDPLTEDAVIIDDSISSGPNRSAALYYANADRHFISYMSVDGKNDSIRLSAIVYTQSHRWHRSYFNKLLLNCHPTVTSLYEAPSGGKPVDEAIKRIVDDQYMVVCPDYCGYGLSAYMQHPYLIHDITARNCVDAAMAAKALGKTLIRSIPSSFNTSIVGYSQGGATALACAKYLESDACPEHYKTELNLKETVCGDGPYSTVATINKYLEWGKDRKNLEYPCVLPLIVMAAKEAYGNGCMRTVDVKSYFSDKFLETGVFDLLKNKSLTTVDLNKKIMEKMNNHLLPTDIFSPTLIDEKTGDFITTTNEYKCLMRALETNDLTKGWEPQHPITFFHLKNDGVVPYVNYEAVFDSERKEGIKYNKDKSENSNVRSVDPGITMVTVPGLALMASSLPYYGLDWGGQFHVMDLDKLNHATGGTYFYILYLFEAGYLR